jgi:hypothetical protein
MRYDNAPNVHGRGKYRKFGREYPKEKQFGRYLLREKNTNTIHGRKVKLSIWTGLIWLRMFVSNGI